MDLQVENNNFLDPGNGYKTRPITPNTLHKNLIEIAQQSLIVPNISDNYIQVNRCTNEYVHGAKTKEKKTTFSPFTIKFQKPPSKSELQLEKELFVFWKKCSSSFDPSQLHVITRFGFEGRLQIHAQDNESYDTLTTIQWPIKLDKQEITIHLPTRVPPHHSIVIRDVPLSWQLPEIKNEIEEKYGNGLVRNIIRMYRKDGNPITSVRLDVSSPSQVITFLKDGFINIGYGRHTVKEYHMPIRIPSPCYNCHEHGHFARNCMNSKRCSRCSEQHDGECQNVIKCASCGGHHYSGQSACPIVQHLRAEKRRQQQPPPQTMIHSYAAAVNRTQSSSTSPHPSTSVFPTELQAQLTSINKALEEVKNMFMNLSEKLSNKVEQLEDRIDISEKRLDILSSKINYNSSIAGIKHIFINKSIQNILLPVIIDISNALTVTSRNQTLKKEIETICNDSQNALLNLDKERDALIQDLQHKYPSLQFS